jgi:hypothetical protein
MQILRSHFRKVIDMSPLHLVGKNFIALEGATTLQDLGKKAKGKRPYPGFYAKLMTIL